MSIALPEFLLLNLWLGLPVLAVGLVLQFLLLYSWHGARPFAVVVLRLGIVQASAIAAGAVLWLKWPFAFDPSFGPVHLPLAMVELAILAWYGLWPRSR